MNQQSPNRHATHSSNTNIGKATLAVNECKAKEQHDTLYYQGNNQYQLTKNNKK